MRKEIVLLFLVNIGSAVGYSLIAPLFPSVAIQRGLSESIIGLIIASFAISNSLITPFCQKIFMIYGKKKIFFIGLSTEAICTLFFAIMDNINNAFVLVFLSFIIRIIHGIGSAITAILIYSLGATFVEKSDFIFTLGFLELGWSVGLSIGPLFASYLYYVGGYKAPFIFFAVFIFFLILCLQQIEIKETEIENEENFFTKLFEPNIFFVFMSILVDFTTKTYYYPTLSNHLYNKFGLSVETSSLYFTINMISYFMFLRLTDPITQRIGIKATMVMGHVVNLISVLFVSPLDIFPQTQALIIFGLFMSGISSAAIVVPSICELINILKQQKTEENSVNDIASSIWNLANYIGEAVGPFLGGVITSNYSFSASCVAISLINLSFGIAYGLFNQEYIKKDLLEYLKGNRLNNNHEPLLSEELNEHEKEFPLDEYKKDFDNNKGDKGRFFTS